MISLSGLNSKQREAAETVEGPVLVLAGAGSGKTRTVTYRIAHMVSNLGIPSEQILAVSFTNKAAKEMKERVGALLTKRHTRKMTLATFHSLGVKILRKDIDKLGYHLNFSIYDTSDQLAILREALKHYRDGKKFDVKRIQSIISSLKNKGVSCDEFASSEHFDDGDPYHFATEYCFEYYQDKLKFYNAIDFDDILHLVIQLFRRFPEVATFYSNKYRYIMVDEYQDTNELQFELIRALTSQHNNLCVVGDDDQSIYAFRGADITNILNFESQFPGAKIVKLEQNYRSTSEILELANKVIAENIDRKEKTLWTHAHSQKKPLLWLMANTDHEAQVIVEDIVQHQGRGDHLGDIAILYRSNTQTQVIEDELRLSQIPYTILGGQKFYDKKEIKDLTAYLSAIHNPNDQMAIRRILNVPHRGIGNATLSKFLEYSIQKSCSLFDVLRDHPDLAGPRKKHIDEFVTLINQTKDLFEKYSLEEAISLFIEKIHYLEFIEKSYEHVKQITRKKDDVMMFIQSAERFTKFNGKNATLKNFLEKLLLQDSQDNQSEEDDDVRKNEVTLMTYHSSKGLEFNKVYLIGMEEEIIPHKKTLSLGEDISEERRLCYVAITRAKEDLIMTQCKERKIYGKDLQRVRSRFLVNHSDLYEEQDRTNFGHLSEDQAEEYKKSFFADLLSNLKDD